MLENAYPFAWSNISKRV